MAGSNISGNNHHLPITTTTHNNKNTGDTWQVQYARFFNCPHTSSLHPSLVAYSRRIKGTWLSSSTIAYLRLRTDSGRVVVTVTLINHVVEEHYISKLCYTWPQVSCLSGFPARGSKVVFMSYKDRVDQIHKFAVRFASLYETEKFVNSIKELFGREKIDGSMSGISITRTSSQSEIIPRAPQDWDPISSSANFSQPMYRAPQDWDPISSSANISHPIYRPPQNEESVISSAEFPQPMYSQISNPLEATLSQDVQGKLSAFSPRFVSLLMDCFPAAEQEMQSTAPEEVALKKEIMKYLEDSSFHEMLSKEQKVVNGFEDDLLVQPVMNM